MSRGSFLIDAESRLNPSTVEGTTTATKTGGPAPKQPTGEAGKMPPMPGM